MNSTQLTNQLTTFVVNPLLALLFAVGLLVFFWGVVEFLFDINIRGGEGGSSKNDGKQHMLWGIFGMFIMASALAILNLLSNTVTQLLQ
jgi:hypothetical protein